MMLTNSKSHNESGFATILMVLLIGLAIAGSAVGTAYYVNSAQKGLVASHALTNAKSGAWTGVETFRKYLDELNEVQIKVLHTTGQNIEISTSGGRTLKVNVLSVEEVPTGSHKYHVTTNIQNISSGSKASSTLQIVYQVSFAQSPSTTPGSQSTVTVAGAMNFYDDLNANGNIEFSNGAQDTIGNVIGDFTSNSGVEGFDRLNIGGNATINAGKFAGVDLYVNGTLTTKGNDKDLNFLGDGASFGDKPIVNALDFEANANYVFYVDTTGAIKVDVKHVKGMTNGTYTLGEVGGGFNSVVTYANGTWSLTNGPIATGVLLFKGSLAIDRKGTFVNTILSTTNIDYGNPNVSLTAPNRASATLVCDSTLFKMPTNLCTEDKKLRKNTIGNIALLAGSCTDTTSVGSCSNTYTGGNITFGANSNVVGSIVAGNSIYSRGRASISGPVLASALSKLKSERGSSLGGNFTIDFGGITDGDMTITLPGGNNSGGGTTITQGTKIKWARYL